MYVFTIITGHGTASMAMAVPVFEGEKKWCRLDSNLHCSSRCQSVTKPSRDIFKASSIQRCDERTGAFSYHLDMRPARKM